MKPYSNGVSHPFLHCMGFFADIERSIFEKIFKKRVRFEIFYQILENLEGEKYASQIIGKMG